MVETGCVIAWKVISE